MVKIYRLETCDFNRMYDYIKDDQRYLKIKKGKRNIVFTWVQREYRNLLKARQANVSVPTPLTFLKNVLVLEFIGDDAIIAPKVKGCCCKMCPFVYLCRLSMQLIILLFIVKYSSF